jgi:hypothetical protein
MVMRTCPPVLLAASLLLGGGCGGALDPITISPGCPGQPLRGPTSYASEPSDQLIDDLETGDGHLPSAKYGGRDGYWVIGHDLTAPTPPTLVYGPSPLCAGRGKWSGHFAVIGSTSWDYNWTAVFRATTGSNDAVPFDARAYGGISFWAGFGSANGPDFAVPLGVTTIDNAWNGNVCTSCMDYYGTTVPMTHNWRRYEIRFDSLVQAGWGIPQVAMRRDQLVGFILWPRQQFDIWIDDVRFEP